MNKKVNVYFLPLHFYTFYTKILFKEEIEWAVQQCRTALYQFKKKRKMRNDISKPNLQTENSMPPLFEISFVIYFQS